MDLQNKILENVGVDKLLHFFVIAYLSLILFASTTIAISMFVSITLMIAKELIDKYIRNTRFDFVDILYGVLGVIVSFIIYLII